MWGNEWASPEGSIWRELESRVQCHSCISVFDPKGDGSQKCAMSFSWSEYILLCKANCYSYAHSVKWSPLSPFSFIPIILPFSLCSSVIIVLQFGLFCHFNGIFSNNRMFFSPPQPQKYPPLLVHSLFSSNPHFSFPPVYKSFFLTTRPTHLTMNDPAGCFLAEDAIEDFNCCWIILNLDVNERKRIVC